MVLWKTYERRLVQNEFIYEKTHTNFGKEIANVVITIDIDFVGLIFQIVYWNFNNKIH